MKASKFFLIISLFILGCKDSGKEAAQALSAKSQPPVSGLPSNGTKAKPTGNYTAEALEGAVIVNDVAWNLKLAASTGGKAEQITIGLSDPQEQKLEGDLVIPAVINGVEVKVIGEGAFMGADKLTGVILPASTTRIESGAFYNNTSLKNVSIPDGVTYIGDGAFYSCTSMEAITIPASVTSIGMRAFADCTNLGSITFLGDPPQLHEELSQFDGTAAWVYYNSDLEGWEKVGVLGNGERFGNRPTRPIERP
jgi:hypothetical protein